MTPQSALRAPQSEIAVVERPEIWLTVPEVEQLLSYADGAGKISRREIYRRINSGKYVARLLPERRARNGKAAAEIALSSLPADAQERYIAQRSDGELALAIAPPDKPLPPMPARLRGAAIPLTADGAADFVALRAAGRNTEATIGERRLQIVCEVKAALAGTRRRAGRTLIYERMAGCFGQAVNTLRNWLNRYQRGGSAALIPGYGHNRAIYHSIPEPLGRAIQAFYRNPQRPTIRQAMQRVVEPYCRARGIHRPNRTTIARFIERETGPSDRTAFRDGRRAWQENIMAKVRRDPRDLAVNEMWCADHRRFDFFVMSPDGKRVFRPWLTTYLDLASADFVGWCICEKPSSQSVALALRAGIIKRGVPRFLYHDNGKEFTAKRLGGPARLNAPPVDIHSPREEDLADHRRWPAALPPMLAHSDGAAVLDALGVERVIHALPYSSWSKPIEPMFYAFHRGWENMLPGYCGNSPEMRPEKLKREIAERALIYWDEFPELFCKFLAHWRSVPHGKMRDLSPNQYYERAGNAIRRASDNNLDLLMLKTERRRVQTNGIEVCGKLFLDNGIALMIGQWVLVWYDPNDLTHIVVRPEINPSVRIVVAHIGNASWHEMSEPYRRVLHIRRIQRERLQVVRSDDRESRDIEALDPVGANRMAAQNAADIRAREAGFELEPEPTSYLAAIKQAQRADKQAKKAAETAHNEFAGANSQGIFEQAKRNLAERGAVALPRRTEGAAG